MTTDYYALWVCTDCLSYVEYADSPANHETEEELEEYIAAVNRGSEGIEHITLGLHCDEYDCEHDENDIDAHSEQCETITFSRSSCDLCSSPLAGQRHAMTGWPMTTITAADMVPPSDYPAEHDAAEYRAQLDAMNEV